MLKKNRSKDLKDRRLKFFQEALNGGWDSVTIASMARGAELYSRSTKINDIARSIRYKIEQKILQHP